MYDTPLFSCPFLPSKLEALTQTKKKSALQNFITVESNLDERNGQLAEHAWYWNYSLQN